MATTATVSTPILASASIFTLAITARLLPIVCCHFHFDVSTISLRFYLETAVVAAPKYNLAFPADYNTVIGNNQTALTDFKIAFLQSLALQGIDVSTIIIISVVPGSIVVNFATTNPNATMTIQMAVSMGMLNVQVGNTVLASSTSSFSSGTVTPTTAPSTSGSCYWLISLSDM